MPFIIAIDGPAGAGKSTAARRIAANLGYTYLDTGAMYRAIAWKALQSGVSTEDEEGLVSIARSLDIQFSPLLPDDSQKIFAEGQEITDAIRTPEVSSLTSQISALPEVRQVVVERQRQIGADDTGALVLEGRDIGTVVFPQAQLKIFLTASPEERARRRVEELRNRGLRVDAKRTLAELLERDQRDSQRAASPLVMAEDAVPLDTDGLTLDQVVERILALCRARCAGNPAQTPRL